MAARSLPRSSMYLLPVAIRLPAKLRELRSAPGIRDVPELWLRAPPIRRASSRPRTVLGMQARTRPGARDVNHYYIYKEIRDYYGNFKPGPAYHWFSVREMYSQQADAEVSWRRPLFNQNEWTVFKTPYMEIVPPIAYMPQLLPRTYTWIPDKSLQIAPVYPNSFYGSIPVAAQYGPMKVAYFLGIWPLYKDYIERPDDPAIWPIRGLIVSGPVALQPTFRKLMDYQWRFDYRNRGRRSVPGGYIPMHYIDECYFLDGNVPQSWTRWCDGDKGRGWTEYEPTQRMF